MANLEDLKGQRRVIKCAITRHQKAVDKFQEGDNVVALEMRIPDLTEHFKKYDLVQTQIESLELLNLNGTVNEDETALEEEHYAERSKVEFQYYETLAIINTNLEKYKPNKETNSSGSQSTIININKTGSDITDNITNLKPIPLPNFSGKHSDWFNFYDSFKSLVDDDHTISDIRKFHYLRSCLKDDALRAVESLAISGANYSSAISLLRNRFENIRLIVDEHIGNILNIPVMQKSSHLELRQLLDTVNNNLAGLKVLEIPIDSWDQILINILVVKLDFPTRKEWQNTLRKELSTFAKFNEFMERRCEILASYSAIKPNQIENNNSQKNYSNPKSTNFNKSVGTSNQKRNSNKFAFNFVATNKPSCYFCKKAHLIYQCPDFLSKGVIDRLKHIKELNMCSNCLKPNHDSSNCRSTSMCRNCGERHHTLLHVTEFSVSSPGATTCYVSSLNQVLLSTASVLVQDSVGNFHKCRALLDQGSQANIITSALCQKLNSKPNNYNTTITGINSESILVNKCVDLNLKSRNSSYTFVIKCLVVPKITEPTPAISFQKDNIIIPPNITLADPEFNKSKEIELLLGAELFWNILIAGPIQFEINQPYFQDSKLGWLIGGKIFFTENANTATCHLTIDTKLQRQVENFWKHEECETDNTFTLEQLACEKHFVTNTIRNSKGQFVVKLPFKEPVQFGNSYDGAIKRFLNLEKKFTRNEPLGTDYKGFMAEYLNLQHMESVSPIEMENPKAYYLSHHAVFKRTIEGSKIRVVFDASAPTSNGFSINDNLLTGPTIQDELFSILCRFRVHKYVVSADITKMYRMILIHPEDQDFQRILWRFDDSQPVQAFRLKTVTYGTTCAPFLAVRCLHQLAAEAKQNYPVVSQIIKNDFYMDDLLTGSETIAEAIEIKNQISKILASAGFNLCKWLSNSFEIITSDNSEPESINLNKGEDCKILGFFWNHKRDELKFNVNTDPSSFEDPITKRKILSTISKLFDPLGLVNPIIVNSKILLQKIWSLKLDWDQPVPDDIKDSWLKYIRDLQELNYCRISRNVTSVHSNMTVELHGFADASMKAYGACVYIKNVDSAGIISANLLCAKSRVAPIKPVTLPRLELNAAVLLIKLTNKCIESLNLTFKSRHFWTDSTIVLAWIRESPQNWKQYVGNRVQIIQQSSSFDEWRHVRSADNPADIVSRGAIPQQLNNMSIWWHGPSWLRLDADHWPKLDNTESENLASNNNNNLILERRSQQVISIASEKPELPVMTKFSSFSKLQRVIAYCLRFFNILKTKIRNTEPLSARELNEATVTISKYIQLRSFPAELSQFEDNLKHKQFKTNNKLSKLDPFLDLHGILRVGGRIKHAPLPYDIKHPIVLPEKHPVTNLIIKYFHETELHAGNQATLAAIRQKFWPIGGRNQVRKIIFSCYKCRRVNPIVNKQKMGDLPRQRLEPLRPFYISGVDYAGPFLIKEGRTRNTRKVKAYIALFICFTTKAVHLELVGSLSTECFLAALKRFTARRGLVSELHSDNGTNFVGAERELLNSFHFQNTTKDYLSSKGIKFNFIPPRSPHFGGLWERNIRSVKDHLRRVVGDASLTYEEFYTLLTCVEACLNSRPLTPLTNDPNDLDALTPGHFLIGSPLTSSPEDDLTPVKINRLSRWQRVQQLTQHFWQRWQTEYLSELQARPKGQQAPHDNIKVNDLVVVMEDGLPPLKWRLGRVTKLHPGSDNLVRVVEIKTSSGIVKRAVKKIGVILSD